MAWFFSCLLFGLIHALNLFFGQSFGSTLQQIALAFVAGSVFYLTRRVAGTLILCMLLHAWIDFTTLALLRRRHRTPRRRSSSSASRQWLAFVLALVGVVVVLRRPDRRGGTPQDALATA